MRQAYLVLTFILLSFSCKSPKTSALKTIGGKDATAPSWYASLIRSKGGKDQVICGGICPPEQPANVFASRINVVKG